MVKANIEILDTCQLHGSKMWKVEMLSVVTEATLEKKIKDYR